MVCGVDPHDVYRLCYMMLKKQHAGPTFNFSLDSRSFDLQGIRGGKAYFMYIATKKALCIAWVHAGPTQVLCGFKRQLCLVCVAARP